VLRVRVGWLRRKQRSVAEEAEWFFVSKPFTSRGCLNTAPFPNK